MSDQTTKPSKKTRLIVDEIGIDTETGIVGRGHSYDNGKTFVVDGTIYGRVYHADDHDKIWKGIQDRVAKVVEPAKSAADSAYSMASQAVEQANVTKRAQAATAQAVMEAKQGANDALSRAKSAWDVATSATNAASSAQSGAKQATSSVAALLTSVDTLKGNVTDLQAESTMQASEIKNKVTRSDVTGMLTGYATQTYTQSLVTQKADEWNVNLTKLKNDTQTSVTNLSATVDGIKGLVETKADQSTVTQLSNLIQSKVSSSDYTSTINQLSDDINLRVKSADLISQINLQAGAASIQSDKLVLDANTTVITGNAFIPSAAISSIQADQVMIGNSRLFSDDGTLNLVNQNGDLKALIQVKQGLVQNTMQSIISFSSDYNNRAFSVTPVGATITPTLFFERYDQTAGHWLGFTRNEVRRDGLMFHTWDDEGERFFVGCHARFDRNISANGAIYQGTWNGTNGKPLAGVLSIETGNTIWSGSDYLAIGDHLSNSFTNVMARSFSQQSTLSSKTNIEAVDPKDALDLVNRTDIRSYQYKTDVAEGKTKRYTSLIIDDVNDVSQYYAPDEFTNEERTGRDDGSAVGYLFLAVKELTRRIENLEEKLNG
ncbi:gp58-like family protein [Limosilactobacillus fermentum]|uniref:gp58-like family protein n=1 Tax=Limosilactobacillus fermentum TaxID=1613 RepID=UPI0012DB7793|nr:gp58-like family protein [Limosilactobacillus fermentum]